MSTPSQCDKEASSSEQLKPKIKKELKTESRKLLAILNNLASRDKSTHIRDLWKIYRTATRTANRHRRAVHVRGQIIDLESATASEISHLEMMSDREKQALDAYHALLEIMRADRAIFTEIEEASHRISSMVKKTPHSELFAAAVQVTMNSIQRQRENMDAFLISLSQ
ncbi:hypothetical protein KCU81_g6788, partial [Aureobasidium melanogenum]